MKKPLIIAGLLTAAFFLLLCCACTFFSVIFFHAAEDTYTDFVSVQTQQKELNGNYLLRYVYNEDYDQAYIQLHRQDTGRSFNLIGTRTPTDKALITKTDFESLVRTTRYQEYSSREGDYLFIRENGGGSAGVYFNYIIALDQDAPYAIGAVLDGPVSKLSMPPYDQPVFSFMACSGAGVSGGNTAHFSISHSDCEGFGSKNRYSVSLNSEYKKPLPEYDGFTEQLPEPTTTPHITQTPGAKVAGNDYYDINGYVYKDALLFGKPSLDTEDGRPESMRLLRFGPLSIDFAAVGGISLLGREFSATNAAGDSFRCAEGSVGSGATQPQKDAATDRLAITLTCTWEVDGTWFATVRYDYPETQSFSSAKNQLSVFISKIDKVTDAGAE